MIEILSNPIILLTSSFLFGISTKIADLQNEHGLKLFKGANILFGILWGFFASLIVIGNALVGTFYLAILLHWILRNKIDYLNHGIAAAMILITFVWLAPAYNLDWLFFIVIFVIYTFVGLLIDYNAIQRGWFTQLNVHGFLILIAFTFVNLSYWIVLASYALNTLGYEIAKKYRK